MEYRFEFDGTEVQALLEESRSAPERLMTEAQRFVAAGIDLHSDDPSGIDEVDHPGTGAPPGLWLMSDRGVYLRSNAADGGERVARARAERGDAAAADDSICEFIDAGSLEQLRGDDTLVVTLDERKVRLSLIRPA
jgi:hypothetical protein